MNLTTTLPTALEAATTVQSGEYEKARKQLLSIEQKIKSAISNGQRSISCGSLESPVKSKLESLGYKIQTKYNETWASISW